MVGLIFLIQTTPHIYDVQQEHSGIKISYDFYRLLTLQHLQCLCVICCHELTID